MQYLTLSNLVLCLVPFLLDAIKLQRHTALTKPIPLKQGEVTNSFHEIEIPKGPIAVYHFEADVVEKDAEGNIVPVKLFDAYLHHHVVGSPLRPTRYGEIRKEPKDFYEEHKNRWTPMKSYKTSRAVGFGAGTESRGTPQTFYYPYAFLTLPGEDNWVANVHIINTRNMDSMDAHHCLECPCIHENDFLTEGFYEKKPWGMCNAELVEERNTACFPETYYGGLRCCEDGMFCLPSEELKDEKESTYYLRYIIEYADVTPDNVPLYLASCCDATGNLTNHGAVEYDIPACDPSIDSECIHLLSTRQHLSGGRSIYTFGERISSEGDKEVELLFAVGHQHRGGLGIALYNDRTGELICNSVPIYGNGTEVGNENEMVVAMTTCTFDPPLRMPISDIVRIDALYDSKEAHTGVMSLFYVAMADVVDDESLDGEIRGHNFVSNSVGLVGGIAVGCIIHRLFWNNRRSKGYQPILQAV